MIFLLMLALLYVYLNLSGRLYKCEQKLELLKKTLSKEASDPIEPLPSKDVYKPTPLPEPPWRNSPPTPISAPVS